jgi:hypothetical protein
MLFRSQLCLKCADAAPAGHDGAGQQLPVELERSCLHQQVPVLGALLFLQAAAAVQQGQLKAVPQP